MTELGNGFKPQIAFGSNRRYSAICHHFVALPRLPGFSDLGSLAQRSPKAVAAPVSLSVDEEVYRAGHFIMSLAAIFC